jgi:hypothetical protein
VNALKAAWLRRRLRNSMRTIRSAEPQREIHVHVHVELDGETLAQHVNRYLVRQAQRNGTQRRDRMPSTDLTRPDYSRAALHEPSTTQRGER